MERLYRSFAFVDEVIEIERYEDFMALVPELEQRKIIIVPHGSFVAYLSLDEHKKMRIPYFGNKAVLDWEASPRTAAPVADPRRPQGCRASSRPAPRSTGPSS